MSSPILKILNALTPPQPAPLSADYDGLEFKWKMFGELEILGLGLVGLLFVWHEGLFSASQELDYEYCCG